MKLWRLTTIALGLTVLTVAPVLADEVIDENNQDYPQWEGSALENAGDPAARLVDDINAITLAGSFTRSPARTMVVEVTATRFPAQAGCAVTGSGVLEEDLSRDYVFDETLAVPCNGQYVIEALATTTNNSVLAPKDEAILDRAVSVAVPPPDITGVAAAEGAGRSVTVTWAPVAPKPADHRGYVVARIASDGAVDTFLLDDVTSFVDTNPPAGGGEIAYRVFARRPGATSDSEVRSNNPGAQTVNVSPAPAGSGGDGGTGGVPGGGTGGGGTGGAINTGGRPASITVPRVGTPSRNFFPALLAPPDTGFSEELPFEDREPGEEDAILPDELAAGREDPLPGRGLVIPVATGLVLAVWALHLRFLAQASRPQYYDGEGSIEVINL